MMTTPVKPLHLFTGFGVEVEYMIVDQTSLSVAPLSDKLLYSVAGNYEGEVALGAIAWSNELVLHVIELKTNGPSSSLSGLPELFQQQITKINSFLKSERACLLSTGAHPFMDPYTQTQLWPHENNIIYHAYNEIFGCQGHGWSNLQSTHLNLPFANNDEFVRLHTAIRLLLPIIPALSASTPILDGKLTGLMDTRLEYYRKNQEKIHSITGHVIPEAILSIEDYQENILQRIYRDIAPFDKNKVLQEEWLNSRGAIARFDRSAIEIRIIDTQENPQADLAILALIIATLKKIAEEVWLNLKEQLTFKETELHTLFLEVIKKGQAAIIEDEHFLRAFGYLEKSQCTVKELWQYILENHVRHASISKEWLPILKIILSQGNLAERIIAALKQDYSKENILNVYRKLARCLANGTPFIQETL